MKLNLVFILLTYCLYWFSGVSGCKVSPPPLIKTGKKDVEGIKLPSGFSISVFASGIENARAMCLGKNGTIFVGSRDEGSVYAVRDVDGNYIADSITVIASGLNRPNGVAFLNGSLYVAEVSKIWRYDNIENQLQKPPKPVLVSDAFPDEDHHGWKYIAFGPDGKLYVPVGAPCNICESKDERFASIMRMNADGTDLEVFAKGIRNTVGFAWHPDTKSLWFTDNGRDWLGDDLPPCELNHAPEKDMHFGYPYCHGGSITDPEFGSKFPCSDFTPPVQNLGAHVAPLGILFYTGNMFPPEYKNRIFIAEHGSWNRSDKAGYRVTTVSINEKGMAKEYKPFAEGWLPQKGKVWGRPVALLQLSDGSVLVSDDFGNAIYRITYSQ